MQFIRNMAPEPEPAAKHNCCPAAAESREGARAIGKACTTTLAGDLSHHRFGGGLQTFAIDSSDWVSRAQQYERNLGYASVFD